jgi:hypothetical protein
MGAVTEHEPCAAHRDRDRPNANRRGTRHAPQQRNAHVQQREGEGKARGQRDATAAAADAQLCGAVKGDLAHHHVLALHDTHERGTKRNHVNSTI